MQISINYYIQFIIITCIIIEWPNLYIALLPKPTFRPLISRNTLSQNFAITD
jgi:hypothetical protein